MAHCVEECHCVMCRSIFGYQKIEHLFFPQRYHVEMKGENNYLGNTKEESSQPTF